MHDTLLLLHTFYQVHTLQREEGLELFRWPSYMIWMSTYNPLSAMPNADYKIDLKFVFLSKSGRTMKGILYLSGWLVVWLLTKSGGCSGPKFPCSPAAQGSASVTWRGALRSRSINVALAAHSSVYPLAHTDNMMKSIVSAHSFISLILFSIYLG